MTRLASFTHQVLGTRDRIGTVLDPESAALTFHALFERARDDLRREDVVVRVGDLREPTPGIGRAGALDEARWLLMPEVVRPLLEAGRDLTVVLEVGGREVARVEIPVWPVARIRRELEVHATLATSDAEGRVTAFPIAELAARVEARVRLAVPGGAVPAELLEGLAPALALLGPDGEPAPLHRIAFRKDGDVLHVTAAFGPAGGATFAPGAYRLAVGLGDEPCREVEVGALSPLAEVLGPVDGPFWVVRRRGRLVPLDTVDAPRRGTFVASLRDGPIAEALVGVGARFVARGPGGATIELAARAERSAAAVHFTAEAAPEGGLAPGRWRIAFSTGSTALSVRDCDLRGAPAPKAELELAQPPGLSLLVGEQARRAARAVAASVRGFGLEATLVARRPTARAYEVILVVEDHGGARFARGVLPRLARGERRSIGVLALPLEPRPGRRRLELFVEKCALWRGLIELVDGAVLRPDVVGHRLVLRRGSSEETLHGPVVVRRALQDPLELVAALRTPGWAPGAELAATLSVRAESGTARSSPRRITLPSAEGEVRIAVPAADVRACAGWTTIELATTQRILVSQRLVVTGAGLRMDGSRTEAPSGPPSRDPAAIRAFFESPGDARRQGATAGDAAPP